MTRSSSVSPWWGCRQSLGRAQRSKCRGPNLIMPQDPFDRAQHVVARAARNEAITFDVWTGPSHLQDWSLRKEVTHRRANGLLHLGVESIRHQNQIKVSGVACLFHIFQAAR